MAIPINESWTLTFDEEFNGTSLDTDVWNDSWFGAPGEPSPPVNDAEYGAYDPDQVSVHDGTLHLTLEDTPVTVDGVDYDYTGGIVTTNGNFEQAYGYFEARVYLPGEDGQIANWPGFWTNGQNWPEDGEIDIVEGLDGDASWHYHYPGGAPGEHAEGDYTGWHTYGALWEPGKISFYYDNEFVGEITTGVVDSPHYIILQNGLGEWGGPIMTPSEMQVDWVHVYSIDPDAIAVEPQDGYSGPGGTGGTPVAGKIHGTDGDDTLVGDPAGNVLNGLAGADHMQGAGGNDTYVVDHAGDIVTELANAGTDVVQSTITYELPANLQSLVLIGTAPINGTGNATSNKLDGNSDANVLSGGSDSDTLTAYEGNDTLKGGTGADTMKGGVGNDVFYGGTGADIMEGGSGADVFNFDDEHGADLITDFENGSDKCDLTKVAGIDAFSDLVLTDTDSGVKVDYGSGSVELANMANFGAIDAGDFLFA